MHYVSFYYMGSVFPQKPALGESLQHAQTHTTRFGSRKRLGEVAFHLLSTNDYGPCALDYFLGRFPDVRSSAHSTSSLLNKCDNLAMYALKVGDAVALGSTLYPARDLLGAIQETRLLR